MTDSDPAIETFISRPREQFVEQPRAQAVGRAPAEPSSRGARTASAQGPVADGQRSAQSPPNPGQSGAAPPPTLVHRGAVGSTGTVSVTTGEAITGVDRQGVRQYLYGLIGLQYSDPSPGGANRLLHTHWLQFVQTELLCATPTRLFNATGLTNVNGTPVPLAASRSSAAWRVDTLPPPGVGSSRSIIPWYDYPAQATANRGGGLTLRTPTSLQVFDAPGPAESTNLLAFVHDILSDPANRAQIGPRQAVTSALLSFHFETYLVQSFRVLYIVRWTAGLGVTDLDRPGSTTTSPRTYVIHPSSGPVSQLSRAHHAALVREFPGYANIAHQ